MKRRCGRAVVSAFAGLAVAAALGATSVAGAATAAASAPADPGNGHHVHNGPNGEVDVNVCSTDVPVGTAWCAAHVRTDSTAKNEKPSRAGGASNAATLGNNGAYDPSYLRSAYNAPSTSQGAGKTVAIVDAYDDPNAESDLGSYRSFFGISACTTANGCFRKVNESGGSAPPAPDTGWAQEISLDLDMVSAMCPQCHILLVEASSATIVDLGMAVNEAVALGANAVSNSYGGGEYSGETSDSGAYYDHPGIAITVSSGDNGYGAEFPAASNFVTAVGGTSLQQSTNTGTRNATETAWSGAGSGCSADEPKPSWQKDASCSRRTVADVSAVADPSTGVWVYDTYGGSSWQVFGGTSVASPIVASVYALSGSAGAADTLASYPYASTGALNDVTSGSNGSCGGSYLCTAKAGYDGPTGLGTPNGTGAFVPPAPQLGQLALSLAPASITAGGSSTGTVTLESTTGQAQPTSTPVTVSLHSTSPAATLPATVTVGAGNSQAGFTYSDTAAGNPTVSASATGYGSASQGVQVSAGPAVSLSVSPASVTVATGATQVFTASGADQYGNAANVGASSWTASAGLGTLSCASACAQTTLTAGASAMTGSVTASLGGNSSSANVTVTVQGFTLAVSPSSQSVSRYSTASYTVSIARTGGFGGSVSLKVTCPTGATCSWSSNPTTGSSSSLRVRPRSGTPTGTYTMTVTGTASGVPGQTANSVTLSVH